MKFTVRDWFWLVLVIGLAVGWWRDHTRLYTLLTTTGYNNAWTSSFLDREGFQQEFKNGRVSNIVRKE